MFILDYFTDIARLKDYQDIERANVDKIYGYELFWFLRRHPIQLLEGVPDNFDINEKWLLVFFYQGYWQRLVCHVMKMTRARSFGQGL